MEFGKEKDLSSGLLDSMNWCAKLPSNEEDHLKSLGLTMNNGKARFILGPNEPTSSHVVGPDFSMVNSDDTQSFVVLGKDAFESIQASSLASYVDIKQRSMSIDYNSVIESLDVTELNKKLNELLQENAKLKDALKKNNTAMKQHFNTLASWQEEILKVHQNHTTKFAETKEFITYLQKENAELKIKLTAESTDNTEIGYKTVLTNEMKDQRNETETYIRVTELQEKVSSLTDELNNFKQKCEKLSSAVYKLFDISNLIISYITQDFPTDREEKHLKKLTLNESSNEMLHCNESTSNNTSLQCEKFSIKNEDINHLNESISALERNFKYAIESIQFCLKSPLNHKNCRQEFFRDIEHSNGAFKKFTNCLDEQMDRCSTTVETSLKVLSDLLKTTEYVKSYPDSAHNIDALSNFYKNLTEEHAKLNEARSIADQTKNKIQKVLENYNNLFHKLEKAFTENTEISDNNIAACETDKHTEPLIGKQDPRDEEKELIEQETRYLEEEKKLINSQRKYLNIEYQNLKDQKELLRQEKIGLHEEKSSLDQQSQLYEDHEKTLQMENKKLALKYDELITETKMLHDSLQEKELSIVQLQDKLEKLQNQMEQQVESNNLLRTQVEIYEEDFKEERKIKETLLEEKSKLDADLQKQLEFNKRLFKLINKDGTQSSSDLPVIQTYECPKCLIMFKDVSTLQEHVRFCLNLD